jgi:hypothetical protein
MAFGAILLIAACGTNSSEIVAPETTSANTAAGEGGGIGMSGSGNAVAPDTTSTTNSTMERGGIGMSGSGN